jgi:gluconolactonase
VKGLLVFLVLPLAAQDFSEVVVEKFAGGFIYADGPAWTPQGELVVSDPPANRLYHLKPGQKREALREESGGAAGNAFDGQSRLYTCESRNRRVVRVSKKGALEVVADKWQGKRFNAPNDIVVRKDGHVYFTDPAFGKQEDTRELDFYGVYHVAPDGTIEVVAKPHGRPNGITVSPDGKKLYVSNSDERNVREYDLNRKGEASNERVLISSIEGVPNGIRTDEQGNLYVAANGVVVFTPAGMEIRKFVTEDAPSNLAFGDADLQTLFVTVRSQIFRYRMPVKGWVAYQP